MIRNSSTKGELKGLLSPTGQPQKVVVVPWAGMAEKGLSAFPKTRKRRKWLQKVPRFDPKAEAPKENGGMKMLSTKTVSTNGDGPKR